MANKIDQLGLTQEVVTLSATMTSRELSKHIKERYGEDISHVSISKYVQGIRKERAETTKAVVQEHIKATLPSDLELLDEIITKEREWFSDENLKISERLMVAKELRQTIDTKLKYSGAGEQGELNVRILDDIPK